MTDMVTLTGGVCIPVAALQLAWDLEARGFSMRLSEYNGIWVRFGEALTEDERAQIRCSVTPLKILLKNGLKTI
jgi:hypothetical protein